MVCITKTTLADLGLPGMIDACLFDLDGVLTDTASVHARAWSATFDPILAEQRLPPFTPTDYLDYVDGKPRLDGVRDFLASRGLAYPTGANADGPDIASEHGLARRKDIQFRQLIRSGGVRAFTGSRHYLDAIAKAGLRRAVVTSSANAQAILRAARLDNLIGVGVDGVNLQTLHLRGKPAPDSFLTAAAQLGVPPRNAAVFEDAAAGVQAARDGAFGFVVGVNRRGLDHAAALRAHGADRIVSDLADLLAGDRLPRRFTTRRR